MRISNPRDLGLFVRGRRRDLALTQAALASAAGVSRRWLSDLEAGKETAEIGLTLRILDALGLTLEAHPAAPPPDDVDLDDLLRDLETPDE